MSRDYYDVLGVSRDADEKTIKHAFRKLAKKYHPDENNGNADDEKKFQEINEAYSVLSDPKKRKMYDTYGKAAFDAGFDPNAAGAGGAGGNFQDFFRNFHSQQGNSSGTWHTYSTSGGGDDIFGDIFGDLFGNGGKGRTYRTEFHSSGGNGSFGGFGGNGSYGDFGGSSGFSGAGFESGDAADLHADLNVTLRDSVFGAKKRIRVAAADGSGGHTLEVNVPAGIEDGRTIRLRGKGNRIPNGTAGDLLLKIHIVGEKGYERKGKDIFATAKIPFTTAVFGGEAEVPTLYGNVLVTIRPGTQSGSKIRLKNKGVPDMKNPSARGDEYVTIEISVPTNLTQEEAKALRTFEKAGRKENFRNRAAS